MNKEGRVLVAATLCKAIHGLTRVGGRHALASVHALTWGRDVGRRHTALSHSWTRLRRWEGRTSKRPLLDMGRGAGCHHT